MCGIYGILALAGSEPAPPDALARMGAVTVHRGPDDEGHLADGPLQLGMRRLSIIDLAGGHQPIANEDGTVHVVCNGEIYNFKELRTELRQRGHHFRTRSDTEVLVHLYEDEGDGFVSRLNGMYAFALWDSRRRRLLVGRDKLGIKPLYYRQDGRYLTFASEAKAILAAGNGPVEIDPSSLQEYLALGYVPAPRSIFKGIGKLSPGCVLVCDGEQIRIHRFWQVASAVDERLTERDWIDQCQSTLAKAVTSQMVSDVPLGAFLSGGIDSSAVVSLMAGASYMPVRTYSIGFQGGGPESLYNELPWARRVAEICGTAHREIVVKPDVTRLLPRLLWHMDEPIADSAFITTFLVAQFAREDVTVILSGVGGDELFGGYHRYLAPAYDRYLARLPEWLRTGVLPGIARGLPSDRHSRLLNLSRQLRAYLISQGQPFAERYRSYVKVFSQADAAALLRDPRPAELDALDAAFREAAEGEALARMQHVDLTTQLPDDLLMLTDKMTMATSLECRVPLLDDTVVDLSLRMPAALKIRGRQLKYVLKCALAGVLPRELLHRPKRGFGAPMGAWLRNELAPLVSHLLSPSAVDKRGLFRPDLIEDLIALHRTSREDHTDHLQALVNLEIWCRLYLDGRSVEEVTAEIAEGMLR